MSSNIKKWLLPVLAVVVVAGLGMRFLGKSDDSVNQSQGETAGAVEQNTAALTDQGTQQLTDQTGNLSSETVAQTASQAADHTASLAATQVSSISAEALQAAQDAMPAGLELSKLTGGLESVFGSTTTALSGITDLESARSAAPSIEEATSKLSGLNDVIMRLPAAAKGPIGTVVNNGIVAIQPLIDRVTAIPGVGEIIQPVVAPMVEMLQGLSE